MATTLVDLWDQKPDVQNWPLRRIIALTGGDLRDNSEPSEQFRQLLREEAEPPHLYSWAKQCLEKPADKAFPDAARALQDIMNAVGLKLGLTCDFGRYQGAPNAPEPDGIWRSPSGSLFAVECKSSGDVHLIRLQDLERRRNFVAERYGIALRSVSTLIIVGAHDTSELEAQIRGSASIETTRVIGIHALLNMMMLWDDSAESPQERERFYNILKPAHYTRLDRIVELAFATAEALRSADDEAAAGVSARMRDDDVVLQSPAAKALRIDALEAIRNKTGLDLEPRTTTRYEAPMGAHVILSVSKRYYGKASDFWFGFHPAYQEFLNEANKGFVALACGDAEHLFLIPWHEMEAWLPRLNRKPGEKYWWYLPIDERDGEFFLKLKGGAESIHLTRYKL
jgi:hypothetical protein